GGVRRVHRGPAAGGEVAELEAAPRVAAGRGGGGADEVGDAGPVQPGAGPEGRNRRVDAPRLGNGAYVPPRLRLPGELEGGPTHPTRHGGSVPPTEVSCRRATADQMAEVLD